MWKFILKRIIFGGLLVIAGSFIVYAVIRLLPTSYVEEIARQRASNPTSTKTYQEWLEQLNAVYKLDRGIVEGFFYLAVRCCPRKFRGFLAVWSPGGTEIQGSYLVFCCFKYNNPVY